MKIAFIVFEKMTTLDFVGFFEPMTRLSLYKNRLREELQWDLCGIQEEVKDDRGMTIKVNKIRPDLSEYDMIFVPGGYATRTLRNDVNFISWLQTAKDSALKVSVCTGALLLGAAGWLHGKRATSNPSAYDLLTPYCKEVAASRIVKDGNVITGGGVAASLDVGLFLVELFSCMDTAMEMQREMDYPYYKAGNTNADYVIG
ncbi:DJ-1/PfpI family protein [Paenibacillus sp. OAS669]|uniref:DJ-1/PfpI family protein n=1 Tax=Paenibacillus sp. OAS669 TaxID=2663821 RepID=UPI0017892DA4|nr:DJ-1/PfpI family protein [Paenibacillus sp. OAS669]MBE1447456.1 cyclohexyl-isocyanide hydratase [Paenibacillus sp. OAS669]